MRLLILLMLPVILACLLAGGTAQAGLPATGDTPPGIATGRLYRLAAMAPAPRAAAQDGGWQILGAASGAVYQLAPGAGPSGTGAPCCCVVLPCVLR